MSVKHNYFDWNEMSEEVLNAIKNKMFFNHGISFANLTSHVVFAKENRKQLHCCLENLLVNGKITEEEYRRAKFEVWPGNE